MNQVWKFYLTSFLKNQTYFTPILILFLQFQNLTFQEIFWVFTIGSVFSFIIEIPTGIFADLYGKKRSIIISKFFIFVSYIIFGFSTTFWMFVVAQIVFELGNAFRSGTETAYVYDYLAQNKNKKGVPEYAEVKAKQKVYARIGESIATAIGGLIAARYGFNWVFFVAAFPAFVNFILGITWEDIRERKEKITIKSSWKHAKDSILYLLKTKKVLNITINITIFTSVLAALQKFIQPYMQDVGVNVEYFGFIYSGALLITAFAVSNAKHLKKFINTRKMINWLSFLAIIPLFIIGFEFISIIGVILFFLVVIIENIRSPFANDLFHKNVNSEQRATLGSILEQFKNVGKILILPVAGYFADVISMYSAILILGGLLTINALIFKIRKHI
jgi:MFS family permease